jgi:cation transport regulator ChaB
MQKIRLLGLGILFIARVQAQPAINRQLTKDDALFATYAADMSRTAYCYDQAYHFLFYKENAAISFVSEQGGNLGLAFEKDSEKRIILAEMYSPPVISASFNDLVRYSFYPFQDIKVESTFLVYSSTLALQEVKISNESLNRQKLEFLPYFSRQENLEALKRTPSGSLEYIIHKEKDSWMKEHNIPLAEEYYNVFEVNGGSGEVFTYDGQEDFKENYRAGGETKLENKSLVGFSLNLDLHPGEEKTYRIVRAVAPEELRKNLSSQINRLYQINLNGFIESDEENFSQIPPVNFKNKDYQNLYWSAFSLIRQCMMPPEGESSFNYYVFSREPKWGWGYGGQVFHESLVMLAYAYMDPVSAMKSQKVFMERQWPSGYINYRTGPYLNEEIEYNGQFTSSAPWFNYQNYQVYLVSHDQDFLKEAYKSGKAFYNYYVDNRDTNNNGLCEWGAHAVLESVRDARVAVWDRVGWPANFESPDLNAMLVMEAKSLAKMAADLGLTREADEWTKKAITRSDLINKYLWDADSGFYFNADKKDMDFNYNHPGDLKIMEIIGFMPLWAGVASEKQAEQLIRNLTDPEKFWRRFGIPSLSAEDEYYNPIGYWNGPIWIQWQYLLFRGLIDYGYEDLALELAERVLDNVIYHLKKDHTFWEFYSADDYQAGWNKTYIWTGITARFLIDMKQIETARGQK